MCYSRKLIHIIILFQVKIKLEKENTPKKIKVKIGDPKEKIPTKFIRPWNHFSRTRSISEVVRVGRNKRSISTNTGDNV